MAKQFYDYWFVQFDFPNAVGKPYKSSGGKMMWNNKFNREQPSEWTDGKLIDIATITMGQSPDGSSYNEDGNGTLFYQGSRDFGVRFPSVRKYTTSPSRMANKGDILMSVRATVGAMNIANNDCCIGRGLSALNSKIGSITHLYYILNDLRVAFEQHNAAGTTFGSITKDDLHNLPVIVPPNEIVEKFEKLCHHSIKNRNTWLYGIFKRMMVICTPSKDTHLLYRNKRLRRSAKSARDRTYFIWQQSTLRLVQRVQSASPYI